MRGVQGAQARGQPGSAGWGVGGVFGAGGGEGKEAVPVTEESEPPMAEPRLQGRGETVRLGSGLGVPGTSA